jgi:Protein of unknown function (DUF3618)
MTETTTARNARVPDDMDALQDDIEDARVRLGATVDEIGHRLDVKTRLKSAVHDAGRRANAVGRSKPVLLAGGGLALGAAAGASVLAWRRWGR